MITIGVIIFFGYKQNWTGFGDYLSPPIQQDREFERRKTLWDWLQLFVIPVALASVALLFNYSQNANEQALAEQRAKLEREIAADNLRENTLQAYFDRMAELLLDQNLRASTKDSEVSAVARVRTLSVLQRLDEERKGDVLRFLYEAGLINGDEIVIPLVGADFQNIDLSSADLPIMALREAWRSGTDLSRANLIDAGLFRTNLSGINLSGVNLSNANFSGTGLHNSDLSNTNLSGANLSDTDLTGVDLRGAWLLDVNFDEANLRGANLSGANLSRTDLSGVNFEEVDLSTSDLLRTNLSFANLTKANLGDANLGGSNLRNAVLRETNLESADLSGAILEGADLSGANLLNALVTSNQLTDVSSLKDAIMPDGSTHN